jgi:predicted nucleic acid-binding protein
MEHYLADTNVIIDMLLDREDADAACAVVDGAERGEYKLSLCALSYTNIYYSMRKFLSHQERIDSLIQLNKVITALPVDGSVIDAALHSGWKDFEDAVQYFTALATTGITGIITRNAKDFRDSQLPVIDPKTFLNSR